MAFDYLFDRQQQRRDADRDRSLVPRRAEGVMLVEPDGSRCVNFGSNDYLGLAFDSASSRRKSAEENLPNRGSTASALVCGWTVEHQALADDLAALESTEAAVVFPSGFAACCGTIATLAEGGDLILSDSLNHASLIDGCRLSRADCIVYPHRDCDAVERLLIRHRPNFHRVWIVTDSVFSMDGHTAPLPRLCELAESHDATVIVDEAHGTGVLGDRGGGLCEQLGVQKRVPIRIGTLSKAIGSQGGFVAGPQIVVDHLINQCRTLIYSTSLSPNAVWAARRGLAAIRENAYRRRRVQALSSQLRRELSIVASEPEMGVPIVPIPFGSASSAVDAAARLRELGCYVPAIRPPTVPEGTSRLRVSLSAAHTDEQLQLLMDGLRQLKQQ